MNRHVVRMVAAREIRQKLRSTAFLISTGVVSLLLTVAVVLPSLLSDRDDATPGPTEPTTVALVSGDPVVVEAIEVAGAAEGRTVSVQRVVDRAAGERLLEDGEVDLLVVPGEVVLSAGEPGLEGPGFAGSLATAVPEAVALSAAGIDPAALALAKRAGPLEIAFTDADLAETAGGFLIANIGAVFVYATLLMYGAWMVNGVIEEKGSRVVEILLSTIRPHELMAGKVAGLGAIGVLQTAAIFGPPVVAAVATDSVAVPTGAASAAGIILLWWLLGFGLYGVLTAAAGALVSRPEESQVVMMPVTMTLVASYGLSFVALANPDGATATVASLVPFTAPTTMLVRQLVADVPSTQVAAAIVGVVVTAAVMTRVAARIYAGGLLRTGGRVKLRDAWAAERS